MTTTITIPSITIPSISIDPRVAIRHGLALAETGPITVTSQFLDSLWHYERVTLASLLTERDRRAWMSDLPEAEHVALIRQPGSPAVWKAAMAAVVAARAMVAAAEADQDEQQVTAALCAPLLYRHRTRLNDGDLVKVELGGYVSDRAKARPGVAERIAARLAEGEPERCLQEAASRVEHESREAQRLAERQAADAKAQAKRAHLAARLAEIRPDLVQQHADGMLRADVAKNLVACAVLDSIAPGDEVQTCDADACEDCGSERVDCLPPAVYQRLAALRATLPTGATLTEPERADEHTHYGVPVERRYRATLRVPDGPYTWVRTIDLGTDEES